MYAYLILLLQLLNKPLLKQKDSLVPLSNFFSSYYNFKQIYPQKINGKIS